MSALIEHAKREFEMAGWTDDEMQQMIMDDLIELLEVFSKQEHSGMSAPYVLSAFEKLARFNPLTPLTGEDNEWQKIDNNTYQNVRNSSVFKNGKDGQAYYLDGNIFRNQDGVTFVCDKSRTPVKFPWVQPESKYIDIYEEYEDDD